MSITTTATSPDTKGEGPSFTPKYCENQTDNDDLLYEKYCENTIALLVGVDYEKKHQKICDIDVENMSRTLKKMKVKPKKTYMLTGDSATHDAIIKSLDFMVSQMEDIPKENPSRLIFYFSGHSGIKKCHNSTQHFLMPADYDKEKPSTRLLYSNLVDTCGSSAMHTTLIVDSCYSSGIIEQNKHASYAFQQGKYHLETRIVQVIASCASFSSSEFSKDGSLFTKLLCTYLNNGDPTTGKNLITLSDICHYIRKQSQGKVACITAYIGSVGAETLFLNLCNTRSASETATKNSPSNSSTTIDMNNSSITLRYDIPNITSQVMDVFGRKWASSAKIGHCIYIYGGDKNGDYPTDMYMLHTDSMVIVRVTANAETSFLAPPLAGHTMCSLEKKLIIFGGLNIGGFYNDHVIIFDTVSKDWSYQVCQNQQDAPCAREGHSMVLYYDPIQDEFFIYIMFGQSNNGPLNDMYVLRCSNWHWRKIKYNTLSSYIPSARIYANAVQYKGKIYVIGGVKVSSDGKQFRSELEMYVFDIELETWLKPIPLPKKFFEKGYSEHALGIIRSSSSGDVNNYMILIGGVADGQRNYLTMLAYEFETDYWMLSRSPPGIEMRSGATIQNVNQKLFVIGGNQQQSAPNNDVFTLYF